MGAKNWIRHGVVMGMAVVMGMQGTVSAQPSSTSDPDALLSPQTSLYLRVNGYKDFSKSFEKTVAHRVIVGSGLADMLIPIVKRGVDFAVKNLRAPEEAKPTILTIKKTVELVLTNGATVGIVGRILGPEAAIVLHDAAEGGLADEIQTRITEFLQLAEIESTQREIDGRQLGTVKIPTPFGPIVQVGWWKEGQHLAFVIGYADPADAVRRATGTADGLTKSKKYSAFRPHPDYAVAGQFWVDVEALFAQIPAEVPQVRTVLDLTGLGGLKGAHFQWGFDGDAVRSDVDVLLPAPRKGFMKLLDGPAASLESLPKLPPECDLVTTLPLNGAHFYDTFVNTVKAVFEEVSPNDLDEFNAGIEAAEEVLKLRIRDDIAGTLGDSAVIYYSQLDGPLGIGGINLVLGVKDRDRLAKTLDRLAEILKQQDSKVILERKKQEGADLWIGGYREEGFPLAPTIGLTDRWAIIGAISPSQVLRFLNLQKGGSKKTWKAPERLVRHVGASKGTVRSVTYFNIEPLARMFFTSLPLLAAMARNSVPQLQIDLTQLPDLEQMVTGLFPATAVVSVDDQGVHIVSLSPLP